MHRCAARTLRGIKSAEENGAAGIARQFGQRQQVRLAKLPVAQPRLGIDVAIALSWFLLAAWAIQC